MEEPLAFADVCGLACGLLQVCPNWRASVLVDTQMRAELFAAPGFLGLCFPPETATAFDGCCTCHASETKRPCTCLVDEELCACVRALLESIDAFNESYADTGVYAVLTNATTQVHAAAARPLAHLSMYVSVNMGYPTAPPITHNVEALLEPLHGAFALQAVNVHLQCAPHCDNSFMLFCMPALFLMLQRGVRDAPQCSCTFLQPHQRPLALQCYSTSFRPQGIIHKRRRFGASGFSNTDMFALETECELSSTSMELAPALHVAAARLGIKMYAD